MNLTESELNGMLGMLALAEVDRGQLPVGEGPRSDNRSPEPSRSNPVLNVKTPVPSKLDYAGKYDQ